MLRKKIIVIFIVVFAILLGLYVKIKFLTPQRAIAVTLDNNSIYIIDGFEVFLTDFEENPIYDRTAISPNTFESKTIDISSFPDKDYMLGIVFQYNDNTVEQLMRYLPYSIRGYYLLKINIETIAQELIATLYYEDGFSDPLTTVIKLSK